MKTYQKSKDGPNQAGPGFNTPSQFRGSKFGQKQVPNPRNVPKFTPGLFKTQHKG